MSGSGGPGPIGQDLQTALQQLESAGQLRRVKAPVRCEYETAAVLWEMAHGDTVLFENLVGYDMPVVGNLLNRRDHLATILGVAPRDLGERVLEGVEQQVEPVLVDSPLCQQEVTKAPLKLLSRWPVPRISERDGGRYLSAGILITRDPDNGRQNMAISRMDVRDDDTLGCYLAPTHSWQFLGRYRQAGEMMPVAVVLGAHPAVTVASQMLVPFDEMRAVGGMLGEPLRVARCLTNDLLVPADAEMVLEGFIDPEVFSPEGPFGEFPGTYAPVRQNPVIQLECLTSRRKPVFQMIVGGRHPEHLVTGAIAREATLLRSVRAVVPGAKQAVLTEGGCCRFHAVIAIQKRAPGEGKLAIAAAFASQDLIKHVTVVDDDIDASDSTDVEWAVATRMRAPDGIAFMAGMKSNPVDPTSSGGTITKVGVDATLPPGEAASAERVGVPAAVSEEVRRRWSELMAGAS